MKIYTNINDEFEYHQIPFDFCNGSKEFYNKSMDWSLYINELFFYSNISDDDISQALDSDLSYVDLSKEWFDSQFMLTQTKEQNNVHTLRIAKLVKALQSNCQLDPISFYFDVDSLKCDCYNYVEDGNHRIRALQYLKYTHFPAIIHGSHADILIEEIQRNIF